MKLAVHGDRRQFRLDLAAARPARFCVGLSTHRAVEDHRQGWFDFRAVPSDGRFAVRRGVVWLGFFGVRFTFARPL